MDMGLKETEILFALKLASGEPVIRQRAFRTLSNWIRKESAKQEFGYDSLLNLAKGLHYAMWMQDKMLWQEQLADDIASLLNVFERETESVLFFKCLLITLSKEWTRIDRWRMDKFLMLMRRVLRALFLRLRLKDWEPAVTDMYINAFKDCVISNDKSFVDGLKFHFLSIYLDELDGAGGLEPDQVTYMLKPFVELLADGTLSEYLFDSILEEIFLTILHQFAEELAENSRAKKSSKQCDNIGGIKFNYKKISNLLSKVGKKSTLRSSRRRKLFDAAKRFRAAASGENPFVMVTKKQTRLRTKISDGKIQKAVTRLLKDVAQQNLLKEKRKLAVKMKSEK
ncbi:unnamed protein product [Thelazia callipaeda]|uniref:Ribosomal RNA processing protein 1-like protein n=1 Tax=Thelazia callipaeda TaxID=103827 RepID=A0A0N5CQW1_THECL|nr:unnamed protein product [Thelazia callipaeda]